MNLIYPDYYPHFRCLAGSCPDTCCKGWQIILDEATLARYRALPGALGERIRASLVEEDGETRFAVADGHCPLLADDGLCDIQRALGESALCRTCGSHPRFSEVYGLTEEQSLSVSCPAAARLLLARTAPVQFVHDTDDRPLEGLNDLDPELYQALDRARGFAIRLVQDRRLPLPDRLALLLLFAKRLQGLLDDDRCDLTGRLIAQFTSDAYLHRQRTRLSRLRGCRGSFTPLWLLLRNMEHLTQDFPALLERALHTQPPRDFWRVHSAPMENLCVYFLFRYFKKAVNNRQLLPRVCVCVFHLIAVRQLFGAQEDASQDALIRVCSLYSKEVEHSEDNMALLQRAFSRRALTGRALIRLL
mgnify:FL=1